MPAAIGYTVAMILPILSYGNEVLREKTRPVEGVTPGIQNLARDMLETMYHAEGVGVASNQVGRTESLCVVDVPGQAEKPGHRDANAAVQMPLVMINPEITATAGSQRNSEGCLSFPDVHVMITRPEEVTVAYTGLDGARQTLTARGLLARAIQHEVDHLNGVLLIDRMSPLQKIAVNGQLKRLLNKKKATGSTHD